MFDLYAELPVEGADLVGEHDEMQQHVGVNDQEERRAEPKEARERQIDTEKRQLTGFS